MNSFNSTFILVVHKEHTPFLSEASTLSLEAFCSYKAIFACTTLFLLTASFSVNTEVLQGHLLFVPLQQHVCKCPGTQELLVFEHTVLPD